MSTQNDTETCFTIVQGEKRKIENEDEIHINKKVNVISDNNEEIQPDIQDATSDAEKDGTTDKNKDENPVLFNGQDISKLSKSQMKKYKKMLSWQANKKEKRQKEKQRAKQRKIEARINNIDLGPSRKQLKQMKMSNSPCKTGVIIDLSFDDLMIPKVFKCIFARYFTNNILL